MNRRQFVTTCAAGLGALVAGKGLPEAAAKSVGGGPVGTALLPWLVGVVDSEHPWFDTHIPHSAVTGFDSAPLKLGFGDGSPIAGMPCLMRGARLAKDSVRAVVGVYAPTADLVDFVGAMPSGRVSVGAAFVLHEVEDVPAAVEVIVGAHVTGDVLRATQALIEDAVNRAAWEDMPIIALDPCNRVVRRADAVEVAINVNPDCARRDVTYLVLAWAATAEDAIDVARPRLPSFEYDGGEA